MHFLENGFNPIWNEICEFHVKNSHFAMLRFEVQDEDMFGEPNFIGQAVFPVRTFIHLNTTESTINNNNNHDQAIHKNQNSTLIKCVSSCFQINSLRTGLRSVPLRNKYSEELELSALLVQIQIKNLDSK